MLTRIELQLQLPVILGLLHLYRLEQVLDFVLCQEGTSQYSHDFIDASVEFKCPFNYCNSTVRDDSHINLYPYSTLCISPEGLNAHVPLHPFEEDLHGPSIFINECNVLGLQKKIVRVVSEGSFEFSFIIYYSPDFGRVVFCVSPCGEPHSVISEDIIRALQKVFSGHHLKLWSSFFPYDEERVEHLDTVQPVQIPVATVKNIAGKRLVVNPVHSIHIMNCSFCDIERYWYLGHYIKLCVYLYARLGASEPCPFKKRHTEIYGSGIKSIVLPVEFKLLVDTLFLGKFYHMIGKFFKNMIITKLIHSGQLRSVNGCPTKTKVKGFLGVCGSYVSKFTKAVTAIQLTEHQNKHLIPTSQTPLTRSIFVFCHNPFEKSLRYEFYNLTENILALVHVCLTLWFQTNITISKGRQGYW